MVAPVSKVLSLDSDRPPSPSTSFSGRGLDAGRGARMLDEARWTPREQSSSLPGQVPVAQGRGRLRREGFRVEQSSRVTEENVDSSLSSPR